MNHPRSLTAQEEGVSGLNRKPPAGHAEVYAALTDHQLREEGWRYTGLIREVHRFRDIFDREFRLELPEVAFCIGRTRMNCYGYFRPGHNQFGFRQEILLNEPHVLDRIAAGEFWKVLGTVLHELLHAWQGRHGTPGRNNYHNAELRRKAAECGLAVDHRGVTEYQPDGAFVALLDRHGVSAVTLPDAPRPQPTATKLKKWVCGCRPAYGVRVAVAEFEAECLRCRRRFIQAASG